MNRPVYCNYHNINISGLPEYINSTLTRALENHLNKIDWDKLSNNHRSEAINLLKNNLDKVNWHNGIHAISEKPGTKKD